MSNYWKYDKGSEWRKCDLHIHSNASDGKMNCQEIIDKALEKDIELIALTDHHTVKNIDEIKNLSKNKISVISGIEFRTEYGDKSVHLIGLLPDEHNGIILNSKNIEDLILSPLGLSEAIIINKGRNKLISEGKTQSEISNESAFKIGTFLVQVDFKRAADLIHKYGGLVIPHAGTKENGIEQEMKHEGKQGVTLYNSLGPVKEELFSSGFIDICEIRKENDNEEFYISKFGIPSIITSDAHSLEEVGSKFTWIKADPTFEGLKQIAYEPGARVKIQTLKPDVKNERHIISEIQFISSDNLFGNQKILFNENLNAIIGGKSSGKSLLIHSISESIDIEQVKRISKRLNFEGYSFSGESFDMEVIWKNGEKDLLSDNNPENKSRKITYIPQLYINYLAEKNNKEELNSLIGNILLQDSLFKVFFEEITNRISSISQEIENQLTDLISTRNTAIELNSQIKEIGASKTIESAIKKLEEQIKEGQKLANLSPEEAKEYNELISKKEKLEKEKRSLLNTNDILSKFQRELVNSKSDIFGNIDEQGQVIKKGQFDKILDEYSEISDEIYRIKDKIYTEFEGLIGNLKVEVENLNIKIKLAEIQAKIDSINKSLIPFNLKLASQKELLKLNEQLIKEKAKKIKAESLEKQFDSHVSEYYNIRKRISVLLDSRFKLYTEISKEINETKNEIGEEITLQCSLTYRKDKLLLFDQANKAAIAQNHFFNDYFNGDYVNYELIPPLFDNLARISDDLLFLNDKTYIPLRQKVTIEEIFRGLIADNFHLDYKVTYKNDELLKMSPGKKGTVLLILFLQISSAEYPILIDQPEDNLDNRTIYELLCKIIKEKKKERQIIVVSHNANLVVATDSENIIVANQEGEDPEKVKSEYRFEYVNAGLECTFPRNEDIKGILYQQGIKEHVCDILEGGNEAFKQRERKYAIK